MMNDVTEFEIISVPDDEWSQVVCDAHSMEELPLFIWEEPEPVFWFRVVAYPDIPEVAVVRSVMFAHRHIVNSNDG